MAIRLSGWPPYTAKPTARASIVMLGMRLPPRSRPTMAANIHPAQHVTEVCGHPAWTIMGPDSSNAVPPNAAARGPSLSARHST